MDPNRQSPYQPGSSPQPPTPQSGQFPQPPVSPYQPSQTPSQAPSQFPQPNYSPQQHSSLGTTGAPQPQAQPQPQSAPQNWYTPPADPNANRPNDVNSYLRTAGAAPAASTQNTSRASGQTVNGQYSIDYLDQLAAPASQGIDKRFVIVGIAGALALIAAAFMIFSTPKTASVKSEISLYTTMIDTEASTRQSNRLIKNSQLAAVNSNFRTALNNAARDMEEPLSGMGENPTKLKSSATKEPYHDAKLVTTLEDARLNGVYDRAYANSMDTKVRFILTYMESIEQNNSRESMKKFISSNKGSFETIQKSIDEIQKSSDINL